MTARLFDLMRATWPAASTKEVEGWTIRDGQGGGSRVSAATWDGTGDGAGDGTGAPNIAVAEAAMERRGQVPLFMIRPQDDDLDAALSKRGYVLRDATLGYHVRTEALAAPPPSVTSFAIWPPLAIQTELWQAGGIGPERLAVMDRVQGPKTAIFGRINDKPAGVAFIACDGNAAMLHALEVAPAYRRRGLARIMMRHAALWAQDAGAEHLYLLVTRQNTGAGQLYTSLNFQPVGHYHYRIRALEAES